MPVLHPSGKGPDITVLNKRETQTSDYVMRELEITRESDEKRKIYHFQFKSWPDHGVPKDPGKVLLFYFKFYLKLWLVCLLLRS